MLEKSHLGKKWRWFQMIPFGEWIRMVQFSFQTDIILISYKSSLSQMIDLIVAMNFVKKSSQSDKISLGFDQFKIQTNRLQSLSQMIDLIITINLV